MSFFRPLVIIPSYNTGPELLLKTVKEVLIYGVEVLVVIDGSTDGSLEILEQTIREGVGGLTLFHKESNSGKGDSLRIAAAASMKKGYSHALVMDSDGQHPAEAIPEFIKLAETNPHAIIMGQPIFGKEAPLARVYGRKLTTFWTNLETLWCGLGDTLFGMRVYPLESFKKAFEQTSFARGFDFDPEIAVRMTWMGCQPIQLPVKVRYLSMEEGGVSHFHYLRDNLKLIGLHFRLIPEFIFWRLYSFLNVTKQWKRA